MNRPAVTVRRAVEYAVVPGFRPLLLDFHRGTSPEPVPIVVFLHGGGWRVGSRSSFGPMFADWSPTPLERIAEAVFPAQLEDVSAAVRWLRENAGELGVDAGRLVPHRQSERLAAALAEAGAEVDFRLVEGADHLWRGDASSAAAAFEASLEFARDRFLGGHHD